jgi:hypothetical protein
MEYREPVQQHFSVWRELNQHFTVVLIAGPAPQRSALDQPINQLDRTVVTKAELLRNGPHRRARAGRQAFDGEQKLVLLGFNALGAGGFLAEVQELPDTVPELGQLAKPKFGYIRSARRGEVGVLTMSHRRNPSNKQAITFDAGSRSSGCLGGDPGCRCR